MALTYHSLVAAAALRANALVGVTSSALNTTFLVRPLTQTNFQSTVFPFEAIKQSLQIVEGRLCEAIASNRNHPWRDYLASTTANLAHKATLPSVDSAGKQIIGAWGSVYDATDGKECTDNLTVKQIQRIVDNAGSRYLLSHYFFKRSGQRIYHTRTNVKIDTCFYDGDAQKTAIDGDTAVLLPYALEGGYVNGAVSLLVRDDEFANQAGIYRAYFNDVLSGLGAGKTSFGEALAA